MIGGTLGQGAGGPAALVFARKSTPPLAIAAEARVEIALKENPPHVCEECGKSFPKNARLKEHKMTHEPRHCKFCNKVFKSYSALRYFFLQWFKVGNVNCLFLGTTILPFMIFRSSFVSLARKCSSLLKI